MSEQLHDRVTDLLERADEQSGSLVAGSTADDESTANDIRDLADEANEILDSADPDELLEAVGLDTLPDGSEPDSIPAAISQGDPDEVDDLRRLLHLSRLGDRGEGLEDAIGSVRAGIGDSSGAGSDDSVEAESKSGDESAASSADEDSNGAEADEATSDAGGGTSDLEERLRSAMSSSLTDFSDDVSQLQERLEALGGGGDADESEAAGESDESAAAESESGSEPEDEASDESDDGLLGADLGSGGGRGNRGTSGSGTRYSTMAPPPSKRSDMRGTARFSTMPDKMRD
ncbi:hypothetical protein [Halopiger xanaduensis]|uniref:Uncharacterized protein n=1 Tax=Halopiger xanaduensis (strain DSM 18323 / JCM 14033 / SH-6) TaxID=797210 RepID=F8D4S3_HALXS|nr:hypothetical protein [Halopiger xanaduensis]AEH37542.1 hypothetical protein Halxa_2926 [Halopiger xanaduensis SH-6]